MGITDLIRLVNPPNGSEKFRMKSDEVSAIARYWHHADPTDGRLHIEWRDGRHWVYQGVPAAVFEELADLDSQQPDKVAALANEVDKTFAAIKIKS